MNDKNIEMIEELREFVMRVLAEERNAAPCELEAAMEAAKIVVGYNLNDHGLYHRLDDCWFSHKPNSSMALCPKNAAYNEMVDECIAIHDDPTLTDDEKWEMESWLRNNHTAQWQDGYSLPPLAHS